jgi:isoquinoline 1-oxidoreductase alpha subunit
MNLSVNGQSISFDGDFNMPLLWALRDVLGLTGTKFGCGKGLCGACTVHLDGEAIRSCLTSVAAAKDSEITTIEGLSANGDHPLQRAWAAHNVPQCGYCQPGQIMQAASLLASNPNPTKQEIINAMRGNICRCGTYERIKKAIQTAAEESS